MPVSQVYSDDCKSWALILPAPDLLFLPHLWDRLRVSRGCVDRSGLLRALLEDFRASLGLNLAKSKFGVLLSMERGEIQV